MALADINGLIFSYLPFLDPADTTTVDKVNVQKIKTMYKFAVRLGISESDRENAAVVEVEATYTAIGRIFIAAYSAYNLLGVRALSRSEGAADGSVTQGSGIKRARADVVETEFFSSRETTTINANYDQLQGNILTDLCECAKSFNIDLDICLKFFGIERQGADFNRFVFKKTADDKRDNG